MRIDWLPPATKVDQFEDPLYALNDLHKFAVRKLGHSGYFVFNITDDAFVQFAVMEWVQSDLDDTNVYVSCVFHGVGISGALRECRHTWWGDSDREGYIYCPDGAIITKAFEALSEFFDDMIK